MAQAVRTCPQTDFVVTEARIFTYVGEPEAEYSEAFLAQIAEQEECGYQLRSIRWAGDSPVLVFLRGATGNAPRATVL